MGCGLDQHLGSYLPVLQNAFGFAVGAADWQGADTESLSLRATPRKLFSGLMHSADAAIVSRATEMILSFAVLRGGGREDVGGHLPWSET
ncbi:hypothetical protein Stsp01_66780 [Streptomyces sp. NBRC 13847]|nr:hypothetical protein Stsp01_66780 [Streptomyces sp. NBRC 13847]